MLTNDQIQDNKIRFLELLQSVNVDMTELIKFLEDAEYFYAPLTTKAEKAYPGGLCESSLALYDKMNAIKTTFNLSEVTEEDIVKVALFKNVYKCLLYTPCMRNQKNETTGQWEEVPGYQISSNRPLYGYSGISSARLIEHFVQLSDSQFRAICYSGLTETNFPDNYEMFRTCQLLALTHIADVASNFLGA